MNPRLNVYFWSFAIMMIIEHIISLFGRYHDELFMVGASAALAMVPWMLLTPRPLIADDPQVLDVAAATYAVNQQQHPQHEHNFVHLYDTSGYFGGNPSLEVPSRVFRCTSCSARYRVFMHDQARTWSGRVE